MAPEPAGERHESALDAAFGQRATSAELRRFLPVAPPAFLEGAIENPALGEAEMLLLLRNRTVTAAVLTVIGRDRRWSRFPNVRAAIARHPHTPHPVSRSLLGQLHWRHLAELAEDLKISAPVRRNAEQLLKTSLPEMAVGERVALARRATREVIAELRSSHEEGVLRALFGNPRLTENDAAAIASNDGAPGEALGRLASHPKWGRPLAVVNALARNPNTPIAAALHLVALLPIEDLTRLAADKEVPTIVRVCANRRLTENEPTHSTDDDAG
jgi:hypothetical protein